VRAKVGDIWQMSTLAYPNLTFGPLIFAVSKVFCGKQN
jgi:hypothetical protein